MYRYFEHFDLFRVKIGNKTAIRYLNYVRHFNLTTVRSAVVLEPKF